AAGRRAQRRAGFGRRDRAGAPALSAQPGSDPPRSALSQAARAPLQSDGGAGRRRARGGLMSGRVTHWLEASRASGVILIVLLLGLWQFSALYVLDTPTWPPVTRILQAWYENLVDGTLIRHLLATVWRQLLGYWLAVALGVGLGLAMGYSRVIYNLLEPLIEVFRPIPGPAYLPVLVLFVGIGHEMKVVLIMVASLFPILLNTYGGRRASDPRAV